MTAQRLERAAAALTAHGFTVEILDGAAAARARIKDLIPEGASVFTGASETLRLSGIDEDINASGRYDAIRARGQTMDRATQLAEIWRLILHPRRHRGQRPRGHRNRLPGDRLGQRKPASRVRRRLPPRDLGRRAQKVVPDLSTALRRVEEHCLPLESDRAMKVYGTPSAINRLLILNAELEPGRGIVLLLREAIGF